MIQAVRMNGLTKDKSGLLFFTTASPPQILKQSQVKRITSKFKQQMTAVIDGQGLKTMVRNKIYDVERRTAVRHFFFCAQNE